MIKPANVEERALSHKRKVPHRSFKEPGIRHKARHKIHSMLELL